MDEYQGCSQIGFDHPDYCRHITLFPWLITGRALIVHLLSTRTCRRFPCLFTLPFPILGNDIGNILANAHPNTTTTLDVGNRTCLNVAFWVPLFDNRRTGLWVSPVIIHR